MSGLQRELEERDVEMVLLDARSRVGAQLAHQHGVRAVPTLIVFDAGGEPALRQVGRVQGSQVLALLDTP